MRLSAVIAGLLILCSCEADEAMRDTQTDRELIVLAAPLADDDYYAEVAGDIFDFHIAYAKAIQKNDDVLVLTDAETHASYAAELGEGAVVIAPQNDIWTRDFGLASAAAPMAFRYTAAGQAGAKKPQAQADSVQAAFTALLERAGLEYRRTTLLNDGGNFVEDGAGRIVVSRKFLRDNKLSETAGRAALMRETGALHVAFIEADEQGGLEHADGVVAFIEPNVLVINTYSEDPDYAATLKADLSAGLPGVTLYEIVTPYDGSAIYDEKFGSACGLYTNMLVTPSRIYLPQFGIPEDAEARRALASWTDKEIVPVASGAVCRMGGGVRCMSSQYRGAAARRLKAWAANP
jgi:agmatine/peptidylarginine deiminase